MRTLLFKPYKLFRAARHRYRQLARGLQAFQETLHQLGYNLLVSSSAYQPKLEAEQIRELVARGAERLLLIGYERDQAIYDYLERRSIPTVLAWASSPDKAHPFVGFDNKAAMRGLADMVIEMGHRRIGVISGVIAGNDRAAGRLAGIKESWQSHGFDIENLAIIETPYDIEGGGKAFEKLMAADFKPTVIMCGNDVLATGVISKAREMGLSVPHDVSVTGFDDIELARCVCPPLTTVHVPHRQMGREAANALIDLIEKRSTNISRELDVSIVMRGSLVGL